MITEEIITLLKEKGLTRMGFAHNVEIESEFDEDGDEYLTIVNAVEITDDGLIAYDNRDEDENGNYEPVWFIASLSGEKQQEILWALKEMPWDVWKWEKYSF